MFELNVNWKFRDVQDNIEALISQYEGDLMPFLCSFQIKQKNARVHEIKVKVFSYTNIQYWQREKLWETLNGDCDIETFKSIGG